MHADRRFLPHQPLPCRHSNDDLVVIATQFSETKKREMSRMLAERKRFQTSSSSTLTSQGVVVDVVVVVASIE